MEPIKNVHLVLNQANRSLMVNGIEFAGKVCEIEIHASSIEIPTVTMTFIPSAIEADVDGEISAYLELPPHGRLIDADAFDERVRAAGGMCGEELTDDFSDGVLATLELLKTQPTIIKAVRPEGILFDEVVDELKQKYPDLCEDTERRGEETSDG